MRLSPIRLGVLALALIMLSSLTRETAGRKFDVRRDDTGTCKYEGYKPGGGIPNIKPIQSPVCKGFTNTLGFVSGIIGKTAGAGRALSQVATLVEATAKVGKVLSAGFGVFAVAFNIISSFSKPTPNEILKRVDKAFEKLTEDMNNRLKGMEGYVDGKIIQLEQRTVKNEFASLQRYLENCVHETTEPSVRRCQLNSVRDIDAAWPKFEKLKNQFNNNSKEISMNDIKRLEAALIPFRDFASLHLFALQLLINSYKSDPDTKEKNDRLKLYMSTLNKRGILYSKYARWAYERIYYEQVGKHYYGSRPKDEYIMDKDIYRLLEGKFWLVKGANTENQISVKPNCAKGDEHAPINTCKYKYHMRVDGKVLERYPDRMAPVSDSDSALRYFAEEDARHTCTRYLDSLNKDLTTYWKTELISVADLWAKMAEKAKNEMSKVDGGAFNIAGGGASVEGILSGLLGGKSLSCEVTCNLTSVESKAQSDEVLLDTAQYQQDAFDDEKEMDYLNRMDEQDQPENYGNEQQDVDEIKPEMDEEYEMQDEMNRGQLMTSPELDESAIIGKPLTCNVVCKH
ncbi:uncharacterized protein LOC5512710 [Nematostella vectensis]|uniref:uncharacterized protein LOC5512710 n=1 Tax=Nematostella vectensis TaxID=45351 RepID=UPI0020773CDA|nr:uncharacterized protein LOC5512710 [Nematostella vectensis]